MELIIIGHTITAPTKSFGEIAAHDLDRDNGAQRPPLINMSLIDQNARHGGEPNAAAELGAFDKCHKDRSLGGWLNARPSFEEPWIASLRLEV